MSDPAPPGGSAPSGLPVEFRRLMARWATGVSVVTGRGPDGDVGLTVNSLVSVSLDPPLLLVSLTEIADSTPVIRAGRSFAVNVLAADQRALSERFAQTMLPGAKFDGVPVHRGVTGAPLLDGSIAFFECRLREVVPEGDHLLFVGEVVRVEGGRDAPPLVFYRRGYATAEGAGHLVLPPPRD